MTLLHTWNKALAACDVLIWNMADFEKLPRCLKWCYRPVHIICWHWLLLFSSPVVLERESCHTSTVILVLRLALDFSVFWLLSSAELHCYCFWCLGFVKSLLTRTFPAEPVLQGWSYCVCLLMGLFCESWPLPKTPLKTLADQQFMKSSRPATSCPLVGKCLPVRLTPHLCFIFAFKITANPRGLCSLQYLVSMQQILGETSALNLCEMAMLNVKN